MNTAIGKSLRLRAVREAGGAGRRIEGSDCHSLRLVPYNTGARPAYSPWLLIFWYFIDKREHACYNVRMRREPTARFGLCFRYIGLLYNLYE
jgi:hypothetical protein